MSSKVHFHTLDALRFFAFFKVFLLHLPIHSFVFFNWLKYGGGLGVEFFFVLSGFLISYLSIREKSLIGAFDWKYFFMRRILRIWPLYFLMVGFAFATPYLLDVLKLPYSNEGYSPDPFYSLLFLENYKMMMEGAMPNVSPLGVMWSLCIEEHFYIIWAFIFVFIPVRKFFITMMVGLVISMASKILFTVQGIDHGEILTHLDLFCYGGLLAYLFFFKPNLIDKYIGFQSIHFKRMTTLFILGMVLINPWILNQEISIHLHTTVYGLLFALLIALFLSQKNRFGLKDTNVLNYLGRISYGLYVYHIIWINLFIQLFKKWGFELSAGPNAVLFILCTLGCSIVTSSLSFHLFESYFLRYKKYFRPRISN